MKSTRRYYSAAAVRSRRNSHFVSESRPATARSRALSAKKDARLFDDEVGSLIGGVNASKEDYDLMQIHHWILQRKKIGLSRRTKKSEQKLLELQEKQGKFKMVQYIRSTFEKKECKFFSFDKRNDRTGEKCMCGRRENEHKGDSLPMAGDDNAFNSNFNFSMPVLKVSPRNGDNKESKKLKFKGYDNHNIQREPTNAYGEIVFEANIRHASNARPFYLRLHDETPVKHIYDLMQTKVWNVNLKERSLVVSLMGQSETNLDEAHYRTFLRSLGNIVNSTNAIVITNYLAGNMTKAVLEKVTETDVLHEHLGSALLLGFEPWGLVKGRKSLLNKSANRWNQAHYSSEFKDSDENATVVLTPGHTHFLLVDNGYVGIKALEGLEDMQTKLTAYIHDQNKMPVVNVFLHGGLNSLATLVDRLKDDQMVLLVHGSGRITDILCYALDRAEKRDGTHQLNNDTYKKLKRWIREAYADVEEEENFNEVMEDIEMCVSQKDKIMTYKIEQASSLDKVILRSLLSNNWAGEKSLIKKLRMTIDWRRPDLAQTLLHKIELRQDAAMEAIMTECILEERLKFIEVILDAGFSMKKYLTPKLLRSLYNRNLKHWPELKNQLMRFVPSYAFHEDVEEIYLCDIHDLLAFLLPYHRAYHYECDFPPGRERTVNRADYRDTMSKFTDPMTELFLFSVLCNKQGLIEYFWQRTEQPLVMAEVAATIYNSLSEHYTKAQHQDRLILHRDTYVERANQLMETAYTLNRPKTYALLEDRIYRVGDLNLMQLAYYGKLRLVIANPQCQSITKVNWKRGFSKLTLTTSLMCILCPLLLFTPLVKFKTGLGDNLGDDRNAFSIFQKLFVFYRSPITKFVGNCVSNICFATLYSYVALYKYRWEYQMAELVLYGWLIIRLISEIRKLAMQHSTTTMGKLSDYAGNIWNQFDIAILFIAAVTFALRNFWDTFWISRILFAFNVALVYMQLFRFYHASLSLGPKLVIIVDMVPEIVTFMLLLLIFILAYGVASQAVIDPYRPHDWDTFGEMLSSIVFLPYWQVYGELQLDGIAAKPIVSCPTDQTEAWCAPSGLEDTRRYQRVTLFFLALFLLFGNVMLLNMLIAVFTSLFEEVHANSLSVWKWEMYRLVDEFDQKPGLAPPLIILEDIWKFLKLAWKKCCRKKREDLDEYLQDTNEALMLFEQACLTALLTDEAKHEEDSLEFKVTNIDARTRDLIDANKEDLKKNTSRDSNAEKSNLEEEVQDLKARIKSMERILLNIERKL